MHITDPVADMLTRIRNANNAKHDTVDVPASNMKKSIAQILLDEGYIKNFQVVEDGTQGVKMCIRDSRRCGRQGHGGHPRRGSDHRQERAEHPRRCDHSRFHPERL